MLGSKKQDFGLFKTRLTDDSTTYTIVGVKHETEEVLKGFVHNRPHVERAIFCSIPRFMAKRCLSEKMNDRDC